MKDGEEHRRRRHTHEGVATKDVRGAVAKASIPNTPHVMSCHVMSCHDHGACVLGSRVRDLALFPNVYLQTCLNMRIQIVICMSLNGYACVGECMYE